MTAPSCPATPGVLDAVPSLPRDENGPVFGAPWQAQAFAIAVALNEAGLFAWPEWTAIFSQEIGKAGSDTSPDPGEPEDHNERYYLCWLAALERIVAEKGAATPQALGDLKEAWARAAEATPHGQPIVLGAGKTASA